MKNIAIVSDTHGLIRPEVVEYISGADLILHAGDIGHIDVIKRLESIAPVVAVRGNNDKDNWCDSLNDSEVVQTEGRILFMIHDLNDIDFDPAAAEFDVVVSGHTHRPKFEVINGVFYINPSSVGPRRFSLPITLATLNIVDGKMSVDINEFND